MPVGSIFRRRRIAYLRSMSFSIYDASAGSGKTFTLVKEYLKLCLGHTEPHRFKEILAITFTNKAAAEMKSRILRVLQALSSGSAEPMSEVLEAELALSPQLLQERAQAVLRAILHHYAAFSVGTIDQFTHRLIRTFAPDLGLSSNFELELDLDLILGEAVHQVLERVGEDAALTRYLLDYVETQLEEDRSFSIEQELRKKAKHLYQEKSLGAVAALRKMELEQLESLRESWRAKVAMHRNALEAIAPRAEDFFESNQIDSNLFAYGDLPNYLRKFAHLEKTASEGLLPGPRLQGQLESMEFVSKKNLNSAEGQHLQSLGIDITDFVLQAVAVRDEHLPGYLLHTLLLRQIHAMGVLKEVGMAVDAIKEQQHVMLLAEFNQLISEELRKQPAAFLFERLGERYRHFFIDEFQDTSRLQWHNLLPLIENALAQGGSCLLVGDGKQSIYRWRGGDVEQFLDLLNGKDQSHVVNTPYGREEWYTRNLFRLETNRRSKDEIIGFNNALYAHLSGVFSSVALQELYKNGSQKSWNKPGGWAEVALLPENDAEANLNFLLERINWALEDGYSYRDIAILVRNNHSAHEVVEFLNQQNLPVISAEALAVEAGWAVKGLLGALRFYINPADAEGQFALLHLLHRRDADLLGDAHPWLQRLTKSSNFWTDLHAHYPELKPSWFARLSLYELLEHWIEAFHLHGTEDAYLLFFLEEAARFSQNKQGGIAQFLRWWDDQNNPPSVVVPESENAMQVLTIHKSKGLEFPVVIMPFANWKVDDLSREQSWLDLDPEESIRQFVVNLSTKTAPHIGGAYEALVNEELERVLLDSLNVLYVGTTRAEDRLHLLTQNTAKGNLWSNWLQGFVAKAATWDGATAHWGERKQLEHPIGGQPARWALPGFFSGHWADRLRVSYERPVDWAATPTEAESGTRMHLILQELTGDRPVEHALNRAVATGLTAEPEANDLKKVLQNVVEHPAIQPYFGTDAFVERSLLLPGGEALRPDRLVRTANGWAILDYKTGQKKPEHRDQVNRYAHTLAEMGEPVIGKHLVYLTPQGIDVESW